MKDIEIFKLLTDSTGIRDEDVTDYRPCSQFYDIHGIQTIPDAIVMQLAGNGTLVYIPERDADGHLIERKPDFLKA